MKRTFIPLMYDCNDNCISCPVPRRHDKDNPRFDDIKKEIDKITKTSEHIEFNGGEPTLRKDLLKILDYVNKKNLKEIGLLTNVQNFYYKEYVKKIALIKNLKIITTLYGHNSKLHDSITRTPKSFKHKITGMNNLIRNNIRIELRILLHKMNYKHFKEITNFLIHNFNNKDFDRIVIMNPKLTCNAEKNKRVVAEKLSVISTVLEEPIKKLTKKGYSIELYHFPHCILPRSLWGYSRGVTAESSEVVFTTSCKKCSKKGDCSRIWKSYLDILGYDEFKPIKKGKKW